MKRLFLLLLSGVAVLVTVLLACGFLAPYVRGKRCTRQFEVNSNILGSLKPPYQPMVISSPRQLKEIIESAKRAWGDGRGFDEIAAQQSGLVDLEKSLATFDFAAEYLMFDSRQARL